jgi:hypothetical protein
MRSFHLLPCWVLLACTLSACDELPVSPTPEPPSPSPPPTFKLDLPIDRSWVYVDSVRTTGAEPALRVRMVIVTIAGKDSLSSELRDLLRMRVATQDGDSLYESMIWYRHNDGGLWEVAYQNGENVFAFPRPRNLMSSTPINYASRNVASTQLNYLDAAALHPLIIRPEPRLVVKYPLHADEEWVAFTQPFRRTLKCLRLMSLSVPAGEFSVYQLQGSGLADPTVDFTLYDFFSTAGLIRRELHWRNMRVISPSGHVLPDSVSIVETMTLVDIL